MASHASFALAAVVASLGLAACGSSIEWKPPPVSGIPAEPPRDAVARPASARAKTGGKNDDLMAAFEAGSGAKPAPAGSGAAKAEPPKPVAASGALPTDLDGTLGVNVVCGQPECVQPGLYPAAADGKGPVAIWSEELGQGKALTIPKSSDVDVYAVVVRGAASAKGAEGGQPVELKAWGALHAPGAGVTIAATQKTKLVVAVVTAGGAVADAAAKIKKSAADVTWKERPGAIATVDLAAAPDLAWAGGAMHAHIGFESDKGKASLGVLLGAKDADVAQHQHETSWEIVAVLRGDGTFKRAESGKTDLASIKVKGGAILAIPKATQHAFVAGKTEPFVAIQLYAPPGPEQRFKALAAGK